MRLQSCSEWTCEEAKSAGSRRYGSLPVIRGYMMVCKSERVLRTNEGGTAEAKAFVPVFRMRAFYLPRNEVGRC